MFLHQRLEFQTTGGGSPQQVCVAATTSRYMYVPALKGTYGQSSKQASKQSSKQPYNSLIDSKVLRAKGLFTFMTGSF
jgi:hypothetical protein